MPDATAIWIIEDEEIFRDLLVDGLSMDQTYSLRSFASCEAAIDVMEKEQAAPDVVLLDIYLPGMSGMAGISELKKRAPRSKIIMLTMDGSEETIIKALRNGAFGYVAKASGLDNVQQAIERSMDSERYLDPQSLTKVLGKLFDGHMPSNKYNLSERELEVLAMITSGLSRDEIAERLNVSTSTITFHYRNIYTKLGEHKLSAVVKKAILEGLV